MEHDTSGPTRGAVGVDAATLLDDDHEAFAAAVSGEASGPVAVVGDPFAGRETVLDRAERALDATRITLAPGDGVDRIREAFGDGPVVVEGCQHLYERRVGGFAALSTFLDELASVDATVVTGWNRYAWAYLTAVRGLDREFAVTVEIRPLPVDRIAELVLGRYDEMPEFVVEDPNDDGFVGTSRREIGWRGWSVSVPVPRLNVLSTKERLSGGDLDPRDVTFGRLAAVSDGNVGVATALWETQQGTEVRPSDVAVPALDRTLDREEAFCLRLVLSKERITRTRLSRVVDGIDRVLGRLARAGLVSVEDGTVELVPAALPTAADASERSRVL
ncbi:hypothetical protein [Halorubellus sp. PRR65]|uniref:hypothetical protein n=1 Tax=Halorubellus sp. PRR65 TaxID=3098148 RepID=UPI002B26320D|nr:hypothetical protein [Halorubellus sp. PRR65]